MAISDYPSPITKLKGVGHDVDSALEIAQRLGVSSANTTVLRDSQLKLDLMRDAFETLTRKLSGQEQVFIYYSGHGARSLLQENNTQRCSEMLVTADGFGFSDSELEVYLRRIAEKTQRLIVMLDACHSGGVTLRSLKTGSSAFIPKATDLKGESCSKPDNIVSRGLGKRGEPGQGSANFVHIAAAKDSEISFDQPDKGGVATQAWLACMRGGANDIDASGAISAKEIQACAQGRIDEQLSKASGLLPHHITVLGNSDLILDYKQGAKPTQVAAMLETPVLKPSGPEKINPTATLQDIFNNRDDRRLVSLTSTSATLKIGRDALDLTLTSREGGYAYLMMVGSDGKTFDLLFPNQLDKDNLIGPEGKLRLPRPKWQMVSEGPAGKNTLLAIVSDTPRDFSNTGAQASGPFSAIPTVAAKDIQLVVSGGATSSQNECSDAVALRNFSVRKRCSNGYGAAVLTIVEVQ